MAPTEETLTVAGREVRVTNPDKIFFPALGITKLDLMRYYLDVAAGALAGCRDRPTLLKRHPNGVDGDFFYQKRVPATRPSWIQTVRVRFPSGRNAEFLGVHDEAHLAWMTNLGCIEINPWPVRARDVDHPDEMRVDLDPTPEIPFGDVRRVALLVAEVLRDLELEGFPKTSGKRGIHVMMRIEPRWDFSDVRRAALALGREVVRRAPTLATTAWWKEERTGVFIDYNQNARDRTLASAYSVRAVPDARVSCPLAWGEVADVEPETLTLLTVPERFRTLGDPGAGIDEHAYSIEPLIDLAERQERDGAGEAPWPPHFAKAESEATRVAPSRARKAPARKAAAPKRRSAR
jgi:bifunctional non-homologous end joining protein LigD